MNRIYRLVWNRARRLLVVASEISRGRSKAGRTATASRRSASCPSWLVALPLTLTPLIALAAAPAGIMPTVRLATPPQSVAPAIPRAAPPIVAPSANPTGGQVSAGSGSISQGGLTTTINQHSQNLSLNWQSFNVGADSTVNFVQPNARSVAVNRIADTNGSVILGHVNANGQVFLINPNGVLFGQGAQVNVGGLVASTLNISDSELASGTRHFSGNGSGSVINQGTITAANGGYIALLGPQVTNQGTLRAPDGTVALAGGNAVTLSFDSNRLLSLQVDKSTLNALADNRQLIVANGGQVLMSAGAKDSLLASVVNNSGTIQAQTVENRAGKIVLLGGMAAGTTQVAGTLDASAPTGGNGGFVETSAAHVQVAKGARITTLAAGGNAGTWLIDPTDFTIAAGSGAKTSSSIGADTLSSNLGSGNVTIATAASGSENGDIHVNSSVSWSANELTLSAHGDININADLNGSGTAKLALEYGQATVAGTGSGYTLRGARVNLAAGNNFSTKQGSGGATQVYTVVTRLGVAADTTTTSLQGIGNNLAGRYVLGGDIDASATSGWNGGEGFDPLGDISTPFTGTFEGLGHTISGLTISRPSEDGVGLFGYASGAGLRNIGLLGGSITGHDHVGGLVGDISSSTITRAYATGAVTGGEVVGGLAGRGKNSSISEAYATGAVSSTGYAGGLVGELDSGSTITHAYATGAVSGTYDVGGLVGTSAGSISGVYATGAVTTADNTYSGGLVGFNGGTITAGYWDSYSTGRTAGVGYGPATGVRAITSAPALSDALTQSVYADFDFTPGSGAWFMVEGSTRPFLQSEYSTTISNTHQLQLMAMDLAATYTLANDLDASATGRSINSVVAADASGMWSVNGFHPIGDSFPNWFSGNFDGLGHTISGLTINRPSATYVGLFGFTLGSTISDVGMLGGSVFGGYQVGSLVGRNNGQVDRAYATGEVNGTTYVGGLVGFSAGSIANTYATGAVTGISDVGGLVGRSENGALSQSYAVGAVNGQDNVGGLIGTNWYSTISQTYATGQVVGTGADIGGLVGWNNSGTTTDSYWATDISGQSASAGGTAQTLAGLIAAMPAGFDTTVWGNQANQTTPYLLNNVGSVFVAGGGTTFYTPIFTLNQLQAIGSGTVSLSGSYALFGDIDASATSGWNSGAGFAPIGNVGNVFSGTFDGLGHTISGLTIDRSGTNNVGLFGYTGPGSTIRNLGLLGGTVNGTENVGGLIGYNNGGTISQAYATGMVSGGVFFVGGLVGFDSGGTIGQAYATGAVNGTSYVGGLVGYKNGGTISQAYATGAVSGTDDVGGLVGRQSGSTISQAYATGAVSGTGNNVGGLVGGNYGGTITDSYWDTETTGQAGSAGGTGLTTAQMMQASSFSGWDIASNGGSNAVWRIYDGYTGPLLRAFMTAATGTATDASKTYNGMAFGNYGVSITGVTPSFWLPGSTYDPSLTLGQAHSDAVNAGSYTLDGRGLYSGQMGYDLAITASTLTIDRATLGVAGASATDRTYDGSTVVGIGGASLVGTIFGNDDVQLIDATAGNMVDKHVGNGKAVTMAASLAGSGSSNYVLTQQTGLTVDISKLAITVAATASDKVYDATTNATASLSSSSLLGNDEVIFSGAGQFDSKDVGIGRTVTVSNITASGGDAGNYSYGGSASSTADITPATLSYQANPALVVRGQVPGVLSGAVKGLLGDDTLAEASTGTLTWQTPATSTSPTGSYAIDGSGLSALNYLFVQAPGNATALRVADGDVPVANGSTPRVVTNTVAGLHRQKDIMKARVPYVPEVRIINGGVHLP